MNEKSTCATSCLTWGDYRFLIWVLSNTPSSRQHHTFPANNISFILYMTPTSRCHYRKESGCGIFSPVNLWFDLDKIATETMFVGNDSHTHPEQHIKNIEQSK